jgi:hypothetical protein
MIIATSTVTDIASSTATIFRGSLPLIILLFGIGITFYIIRNLVSMIPKG